MNRNNEVSFISLLQSPVHMGLILFGHFVHQNIRCYLSAFVKQALVKSLFLFFVFLFKNWYSCVAALFRKARLDLRALASKKSFKVPSFSTWLKRRWLKTGTAWVNTHPWLSAINELPTHLSEPLRTVASVSFCCLWVRTLQYLLLSPFPKALSC